MSDDAEAAVGDALGTVSVPVSRKTTSSVPWAPVTSAGMVKTRGKLWENQGKTEKNGCLTQTNGDSTQKNCDLAEKKTDLVNKIRDLDDL